MSRRDPNAGKRVLTPYREYATAVETSVDGYSVRVFFKDGTYEWLPVICLRFYS